MASAIQFYNLQSTKFDLSNNRALVAENRPSAVKYGYQPSNLHPVMHFQSQQLRFLLGHGAKSVRHFIATDRKRNMQRQ